MGGQVDTQADPAVVAALPTAVVAGQRGALRGDLASAGARAPRRS